MLDLYIFVHGPLQRGFRRWMQKEPRGSLWKFAPGGNIVPRFVGEEQAKGQPVEKCVKSVFWGVGLGIPQRVVCGRPRLGRTAKL